jgi:Spy/CpxP family protein refolding chaperone
MKRAWMMILLVSLGLNVGLAIKVFTRPGEDGGRHGERRWSERRMGGRDWPATGDTASMRKLGLRRLHRLGEGLDLTPDQKVALEANQEAALSRLAGKREGIAESRKTIRSLMAAAPLDPAAVRAAHSELGRRQAELDSLVAEIIMDDLEILTPDQRERYLRMHPFGGGRGGRGPHGGRRGPERP